MARYICTGVLRDENGDIIAGATVAVYKAGTTDAADVYAADSGGAAVNSVTSGADGRFTFYADDSTYEYSQEFKIVATKSGYTTITVDDIKVYGISVATAAISKVTPAANKLPYFTSGTEASVCDFSAFGRTLVDDATAQAARITLKQNEYRIGDYANLAAAITAIGATVGTLIIDAETTLTENATLPATLGVEVLKGGSFALATFTLEINGPLTAGNYVIFSGTGTVTLATTTPVVNQAWFGVTDAALQLAMGSVVSGHKWYLPPGTYTQTTKITIPLGVDFGGGGGDGLATVINSAVPADVAILVTSIADPERMFRIHDFQLIGDGASDAASTGTGGIKIVGCHYGLIEDVWVEAFCNGGWGTAGVWGDGDICPGIWVSGTVGVNLRRIYSRRNDCGFYIENGAASLSTATSMRDCTAQLNRTYGAYLKNCLTLNWDGGVVESNNGLTSVLVSNTTAGYSNRLGNLHFESNQRISGAAAAGSSEITADLNGYGILLDNIHFGAGATYPEIPLILANNTGSKVSNCFFSTGASATYAYHVQSDGVNNTFDCCYIPIAVNDEGANTMTLPFLEGSVTWDPASLADGAGETSAAITVTGAAVGDYVMVAPPYDLQDLLCSGYVQAANTVEIRIQNENAGAAVNLGSGVWKVRVMK